MEKSISESFVEKTLRFFTPIKLRRVLKLNGIDIYWHNWESRRICGHSGVPRNGDIFTTKMQSGKIAVFEVTKVDWCSGVSGMYFANVKDVGYWEAP